MGIKVYNGYKSELRTGDLLSWGSASALGWLIKKFTKSDINHSGMVIRFSDYENKEDAASRRFTLEALTPPACFTDLGGTSKVYPSAIDCSDNSLKKLFTIFVEGPAPATTIVSDAVATVANTNPTANTVTIFKRNFIHPPSVMFAIKKIELLNWINSGE